MRYLLPLLLLVALVGPAAAEAPAPIREIALFLNLTDHQQYGLENDMLRGVQHLLDSELRGTPGLSQAYRFVDLGQPQSAAFLARLGLGPLSGPTLAVLENPAPGQEPQVAWQRRIFDVQESLSALLDFLGHGAAARTLITAAAFTPAAVSTPLRAGQPVTVNLQGPPGGRALMAVGGRADLPMMESSPGSYQGIYTVGPDDRTQAEVRVTLTMPDGRSETRSLGSLPLEGLALPVLRAVQQVGPRNWALLGSAPPNSRVAVRIVNSGSFLFTLTDVTDVAGVADGGGNFQIVVQMSRQMAGVDARFELQATTPEGFSTPTVVTTMEFQEAWYNPLLDVLDSNPVRLQIR